MGAHTCVLTSLFQVLSNRSLIPKTPSRSYQSIFTRPGKWIISKRKMEIKISTWFPNEFLPGKLEGSPAYLIPRVNGHANQCIDFVLRALLLYWKTNRTPILVWCFVLFCFDTWKLFPRISIKESGSPAHEWNLPPITRTIWKWILPLIFDMKLPWWTRLGSQCARPIAPSSIEMRGPNQVPISQTSGNEVGCVIRPQKSSK